VNAPAKGKVSLVGAGPGDPGLLTRKGERALAAADIVVYDELAAAPIVALAPSSAERIYVGKKAGAHSMAQDDITALIVRLGVEGKRVVRLKGGDVFVFGRGGEEAAALAEAGVPFEIVPGITSAIAAPAYAGIPVTHRSHNTSFVVATGHEDPEKGFSSIDFAKLANPAQTIVFLMAMGNLRAIAAELIANGLAASTPAAVVREGTTPRQRTLVATLETVAAEVQKQGFAAPAVLVVGNVVRERERIHWFDGAPLFGKRVLVTRPAESDDAFAARLWEAGAEPVFAPVVTIEPPDDAAAAERAVTDAASYAWIVFTSARGVDAFFARLYAQGADARRLGAARVAAIGAKTAAALRGYGVRADFVPESYIGEELAAGMLPQTREGDRVLLYRAQVARDVLPDALRSTGRVVDDIAAYKAVAVNDPRIAELAEATDVWTFTSAGIVRAFLANVPGAETIAGEKTIACIGPVTAEAAHQGGLDVDAVAAEYTVEGLVAALLAPPAARV
jgi:uroporphyrinogen III methyltransferase / synthase